MPTLCDGAARRRPGPAGDLPARRDAAVRRADLSRARRAPPGILVTQSFAPADALAVYRAVSSYARGYALAEATGFTVDAARTSGRHRLAALPAERFPVLGGRALELSALDPDSGFDRGLSALLDGLAHPS
jgi:hypothetical protein